MKTELQQKLIKKYPEFFDYLRDTKIYTGEKPVMEEVGELLKQEEIVLPIQFGFECGDGWYMLLDELMGEIKNHIQNENHRRENEFKYKWMKDLSFTLRIRTSAKQKRLRAIGEWIYDKAPKGGRPPLTVQVSQIKEKFGGLRFYYNGGDDFVFGLTMFAESLSYRICETCGTTLNVGQTNGWIYTCCWDCLNKNERAKNLSWKLHE